MPESFSEHARKRSDPLEIQPPALVDLPVEPDGPPWLDHSNNRKAGSTDDSAGSRLKAWGFSFAAEQGAVSVQNIPQSGTVWWGFLQELVLAGGFAGVHQN